MNEIEFARAHLGDYKVQGAEIKPRLCPYCRGGQHGDKYTFALNMDKHTFVCLRGSLCYHVGISPLGGLVN